MNRSLLARAATIAAAVAAITVGVAGPASAHVTVNPKEATQGGYTKVTFRVPNEKDDASTTKIEVNLPVSSPIGSVSLKPMTGWTAKTETSKLATPIKVHDSELTEAVTKITWTADANSAIKPGQFQEFDVSLGPLPETDRLVFKALQTYSDGDVVRWIEEPSGGAEPEHPAPVLKLTKKGEATAAAAPVAVTNTSNDSDQDSNNGTAYGIVGILLGLAGLVAGLLAYRRAAQAR
ncbi:YcnI family protein [Micromonospora soli]|uniref:YcnI family copper-binding membrane protein n=1 Tax=Micromonospora sp. NBRC 110009 TaxID=3061627 RepID=UPI002671FE7D|nr:YcnI family protein [Micromonospora sp. NBRC 110009]WKT96474.1 YcnI family protein [Micromonospora sp. NBRC 110009]